LMYVFYRKDIDVTFTPPQLSPELCLKDKRGIAFHGSVLFLTRLFLGVADQMNAQGWIITTVAAVCSLIYNIVFWPWDNKNGRESGDLGKKDANNGIELQAYSADQSPEKAPYSKVQSSPSIMEKDFTAPIDGQVDGQVAVAELPPTPSVEKANASFVIDADDLASLNRTKLEEMGDATQKSSQMLRDPDEINVEEPTVKASILNCPWAVLPFVFGMFTLVNALKNAGWIDALANSILDVIPANEGNSAHAIAVSTFLMTTISFCLCTLIDNQPASILLTQVLLSPAFDALPVMVRTSGMLGVLEGANVGGCWSLMGALAGIMWSTLLRNKGITIGYIQFMRVGLKIMPIVTFMVALIIFLESVSKA